MKIVSSFNDYYDCMQDPTDKENIFVRETKEIDDIKYHCSTFNGHFGHYYSIYHFGFCGSHYRFIKFYYKGKYNIWWDITKFREFYEQEYLKKHAKSIYNRYYRNKIKKKKPSMFNRMNQDIQESKWFQSLFRKYQTPYFIIKNEKLIVNPNLRKIEFYRIIPTPQCYQEIEKFLFGVIAERREKVPNVSNKDLIEAKGFDLKKSFRGNHGKKRKRN